MQKPYSYEFWKLFFTAAFLMMGLAYYQSTVVLYNLNQLHHSEKVAYEIYGVFLVAVYLCPIIMGWLTKKWLRSTTGITLGLFLYALGTFLSATLHSHLYLAALAVNALGYGLIYINTFYLIGALYQIDDPHREGGFTLAYMALNVGAIVGFTFGGSMLRSDHMQALIISLSLLFLMITILSIFLLRTYRKREQDKKENLPLALGMLLIIFGIVAFALEFADLLQKPLSIICFFLLFITFYIGMKEHKQNPAAGRKIILLGILTLLSVVFWTFYKIQDSFILVFIQRHVQLSLGNFIIPPAALLSINPIVILFLAPLLSWFWLRTKTHYNNPIMKVGFGILFMGIAFGALYLGTLFGLPIALMWPVLFFTFVAIAEAVLGPGIISMVGQLSTEKYQLVLLGVTQLSLSAAGIFSAQFAIYFQDRLLHKPLSLGYMHDYRDIMLCLIGVSILIFLGKRWVTKKL